MTLVEIHAILTTQQAGNKTLLSSIRYGDIKFFKPIFLLQHQKYYSNANHRQVQQNYKFVVCSSITILKHPPIYQNNHSQVLVIISVKITIMNKF